MNLTQAGHDDEYMKTLLKLMFPINTYEATIIPR